MRCLHCRSNLLVTGRKQVLSYYVAPKMDAHGALAKLTAAKKQRAARYRVVKKQLYFIPYYRLTGHDFRWEVPPDKPRRETPIHPLMSSMTSGDRWTSEVEHIDLYSLFQSASYLLRKVFGGSSAAIRETNNPPQRVSSETATNEPKVHPSLVQKNPWDTTPGTPGGLNRVRLLNQYVEKNFIGCSLDGVGLYSLGVRPSVLRLELFRREMLGSLGKIVQANIKPQDALLHGMRAGRKQAISNRKVIGRMLSVLYFPFWVMELKQGDKNCLAIIDAVSQAVITLAATPALYETLDQEVEADPHVIGFRPLTCPNCGWDHPIRPDNVIFYCSSCEKTWQILGNCLYEVSFQIARMAQAEKDKQFKYLPFWVLEGNSDENDPSRLFLPAFRYRQLKFLSDLAIRISRKQRSYSVLTENLPEVQGCFYDQEDAVMLAQFSQVGMAPRPLEKIKAIQENNFSMTDATLTWFPYEVNGNYLIDPFTGHRLTKNLLS